MRVPWCRCHRREQVVLQPVVAAEFLVVAEELKYRPRDTRKVFEGRFQGAPRSSSRLNLYMVRRSGPSPTMRRSVSSGNSWSTSVRRSLSERA